MFLLPRRVVYVLVNNRLKVDPYKGNQDYGVVIKGCDLRLFKLRIVLFVQFSYRNTKHHLISIDVYVGIAMIQEKF